MDWLGWVLALIGWGLLFSAGVWLHRMIKAGK
jgi:hypothetical protein